jgi:hypothetical protein
MLVAKLPMISICVCFRNCFLTHLSWSHVVLMDLHMFLHGCILRSSMVLESSLNYQCYLLFSWIFSFLHGCILVVCMLFWNHWLVLLVVFVHLHILHEFVLFFCREPETVSFELFLWCILFVLWRMSENYWQGSIYHWSSLHWKKCCIIQKQEISLLKTVQNKREKTNSLYETKVHENLQFHLNYLFDAFSLSFDACLRITDMVPFIIEALYNEKSVVSLRSNR